MERARQLGGEMPLFCRSHAARTAGGVRRPGGRSPGRAAERSARDRQPYRVISVGRAGGCRVDDSWKCRSATTRRRLAAAAAAADQVRSELDRRPRSSMPRFCPRPSRRWFSWAGSPRPNRLSRRSNATASGWTEHGCWPSAPAAEAMILAALGDLDGAARRPRSGHRPNTTGCHAVRAGADPVAAWANSSVGSAGRSPLRRACRKPWTSSSSSDTPLWADRARAELVRANVGPRQSGQLTPSEQRVAELAASGMKNRDVATALFISPKTVEANLARIYRKLGIKSRAELGRHMRKPEDIPE